MPANIGPRRDWALFPGMVAHPSLRSTLPTLQVPIPPCMTIPPESPKAAHPMLNLELGLTLFWNHLSKPTWIPLNLVENGGRTSNSAVVRLSLDEHGTASRRQVPNDLPDEQVSQPDEAGPFNVWSEPEYPH